jgi:hypothetical protein
MSDVYQAPGMKRLPKKAATKTSPKKAKKEAMARSSRRLFPVLAVANQRIVEILRRSLCSVLPYE